VCDGPVTVTLWHKKSHLARTSPGAPLKKVYSSFDTYYKRLEAIHAEFKEYPRIQAGIVGIYTKMCNDNLLRHKLFDKGTRFIATLMLLARQFHYFFRAVTSPGFLKKIFALLLEQEPGCQRIALQALQTVTRHGGIPIRLEISKQAMVLTRILENEPSDTTAELVVAILSHSLSAAYEGKLEAGKFKPVYPDIIKTLDATRIVKATTGVAVKPSASPSIIFHMIELLYATSMHGAYAFKAHPDATKILIAGLSSKEWERRCACVQALIRLHTIQASSFHEAMDPIKFMHAAQKFPNHIVDVLMDYGMGRCNTFLTGLCSRDFQSAIIKVVQDRNFYALGQIVGKNILKTEYSLMEGSFQFQDPVTGRMDIDTSLPFKMWTDALPFCAKALRARRNAQDMDLADIIEIKYCIGRQNYGQVVAIAMKAIERNPHQGYWYYAISMQGDPVKGLKAAKQGMKCSQLSPFVKYQLMQRAVDHAGNLGIEILQQMPEVGDAKWYEGIAFLHSALEDAKTYISEAPPDNRNMKTTLYWYILLTVTIKADLSPDLGELEVSVCNYYTSRFRS
jgi:hypothetical protein